MVPERTPLTTGRWAHVVGYLVGIWGDFVDGIHPERGAGGERKGCEDNEIAHVTAPFVQDGPVACVGAGDGGAPFCWHSRLLALLYTPCLVQAASARTVTTKRMRISGG